MRVACLFFPKASTQSSLSQLAEACLRWSPQIALREPDVIWIEIGKCRSLYSEDSFIQRARVLARRFGWVPQIAVAGDLPSALALARYSRSTLQELPIEALMDFADPLRMDLKGQTSILAMIEATRRLGIETLGEFKTIPAQSLPSRFGSLSLLCRQRMEGSVEFPWPNWSPPEQFEERLEFTPSEVCSEIEPLLFYAKSMLDRIFSRLRGRSLRAEQIRFAIELEKYSTVKDPIREWKFELITPQGSTLGFLPILRERLSWDLSQKPILSYVHTLSCSVLRTTPGRSAQRDFFSPQDTSAQLDRQEALGCLFGELEEFLGKSHVFWAQTTEERFPERSWVKTVRKDAPQADLENRYPKRPTRVFKEPLPVTVIEDRLVIRGKKWKAIKWSQVERLSLDWLNDTPARNYYRVDLETGQSLWIFSDPQHHYFVQGYFE